MENYHQLLRLTMEQGVDQYNTRTNKLCRALVGHQVQYDLRRGFPALTTRKLPFKNIVGELLGFFRGYDNAADFRALGCHFWDINANETPAWLASPYRRGHDDLSRIYGKQWTEWMDRRIVDAPAERDRLLGLGYQVRMCAEDVSEEGKKTEWLMQRTINQLENALTKLLTDPSDRRVIVSGWNVAELDMMALPPCHMDYRFVAFENPRVLNLVMTIRSWDLLLGAPANICATAIFLSVMARLAGYEPGVVTIQATNAHIYEDRFDQVRELLSRDHLEAPKLILSDNIKRIERLEDIAGVFARIEPSDITMDGYVSHAAIKAPMAA
jgi:thymidylate synthase